MRLNPDKMKTHVKDWFFFWKRYNPHPREIEYGKKVLKEILKMIEERR